MSTLDLFILCCTVLGCTFLVLLALPKSQLRCFLLEVMGYAVAWISAAYVVSPLDVIPDFIPVLGWLDDVGAIVTGIGGFVAARSAAADRKKLN